MKTLLTTSIAAVTLAFAAYTFAADEEDPLYDPATCSNMGQKCGPAEEVEEEPFVYVPVSCAENPKQRQCVVAKKAPEPIVPLIDRTCEDRNLRALNLLATTLDDDGVISKPGSWEVYGGIGAAGTKALESVVSYPLEPVVIGYCVLVPTEYVGYELQVELSVVVGDITSWITEDQTLSATPVAYFHGTAKSENYIDVPEIATENVGLAEVFLTAQARDVSVSTISALTWLILAVPTP